MLSELSKKFVDWFFKKIIKPKLEKAYDWARARIKAADWIPIISFFVIVFAAIYLCLANATIATFCLGYFIALMFYILLVRRYLKYPNLFPHETLISWIVIILLVMPFLYSLDLSYITHSFKGNKGIYVAEFNGDCKNYHSNLKG